MSADRSKPQHEHDCDKCVFLGRVKSQYVVGEADAYYCSQGGTFPTIVLRHGDEGPEYLSGWGLAEELPTPHKAKAYRLAERDAAHAS